MEVTAKIVKMLNEPGAVRAYAKITLAGEFTVDRVRVVEGSNGIFAAMPSYRGKDNKFRDICYPITANLRGTVNDAVRAAYDEQLTRENKA